MIEGIYPNISHREYHAIEAINNSYLSRLNRCPKAARIAQEETPAMIFGSAFHSLLLEGQEAFGKRFAVAPKIDKRTKQGNKDWALFAEQNVGKSIITKDDYDKMCEMASAIGFHPFAAKVLCEGRSEMSVFWVDKGTGLYCKCRPDRIPDGDHGVIVDVKTTTSAKKHDFTNTVARYGYHRQAAIYIDGLNAVSNTTVDAIIFVAVEKDPPYMVGCFALSDIDIDVGRVRYRELIEKEKEFREKDFWPHYEDSGLIEMNLPNWA